jgi:hypothetical protein
MTAPIPVHPVDTLAPEETYRIYYSRVVDLAVAQGLLTSDPDAEIGHFAFSRHYTDGKILDQELIQAVLEFEAQHPEAAQRRRSEKDLTFMGAVERYYRAAPEEKVQDLILIGASHSVWPAGTSHTLTYPWDLAGNGRPVRFRDDLPEFMKRRIIKILKKAGKLRNPYLFGSR